MATEDDLRAIALALPGVEERATYGKRPSWKVEGKGFVGIWKDDSSAVLMVEDVAEKRSLLEDEPDMFFTTPHYGESPRILVRLPNVGVESLHELVTESWRQSAPVALVERFDGNVPESPPGSSPRRRRTRAR